LEFLWCFVINLFFISIDPLCLFEVFIYLQPLHRPYKLTFLLVVARIRPLLSKELDKDVIVRGESSQEGHSLNTVRIPNPKNESEEFSFAFNGVYEMKTTQEELFAAEGTPNEATYEIGAD
jgi:hypothetical protein